MISRKADLAEKPQTPPYDLLESLCRGPLPESGANRIHKAGTSELICEMRMTRFSAMIDFHKGIATRLKRCVPKPPLTGDGVSGVWGLLVTHR
jgi:hypothetical protein